MPPKSYEDVLAAANRVLDLFAAAFEHWWLGHDEVTRERCLTFAQEKNPYFKAEDAAKLRRLTRDPVPICQLLDAIATQFEMDPMDAKLVRQYRGKLHHRGTTARGDFEFMQPHRAEEFLDAAERLVAAFKAEREQAAIAPLAAFMLDTLAGKPLARAAAPPPPTPPRVEEPAFPMPKVARRARHTLDPDDPGLANLLSPDQREAVERIVAWYRALQPHFADRGHFALAGPAGSGKTTVVGVVIRKLGLQPRDVALLAPTGKAVEALKARLPRGWRGSARTLASFLWQWQFSGFKGEDNEFLNRGAKPVDPAVKLIVVDEASMVTRRDFEALSRYRRVLFTGDPDQLPPVVEDDALESEHGSSGVLDRPDATLAAVHRQEATSAIRQAFEGAKSRRHPPYGPSADGRVVHLSEREGHFGVDQLHAIIDEADVVLTQRNSLRVLINEYVRWRRGHMRSPVDFVPKAGEILVCSENYMHPERRIRVANGERMVVTEYLGPRQVRDDESGVVDYAVRAYPEGREVHEAEWVISSQMLNGDQIRGAVLVTEHVSGPRSKVLRADWGYALTVHKAQGSEWSRVVIVDDLNPDHQIPLEKWYYVAYSRAIDRLVILKVRRDTLLFTVGWGRDGAGVFPHRPPD